MGVMQEDRAAGGRAAALAAAVEAHARAKRLAAQAEELHARAREVRRAGVQAAIDAGLSAVEIAAALGVTRGRVYQIKDGA